MDTQEKIPQVQNCLFQMLCEVDRICKKHGIPYFLAGGTLLGAVRHRDFIPWDDDLDIMMLRRDYRRFLEAAPKELPSNLFLQTPATEKGNHYLITKLRLEGTVFATELLMGFPDLHRGIFVDIIAQDYTANSRLGRKIHLESSRVARSLVYRKWTGKGCAPLRFLLRCLPFGLLEWFQHRVLTLFEGWPGRRFLYDSMGTNLDKGAYPASWLWRQAEVEFHGKRFPAPAEYDKYLRYLYGDYMKLPPQDRRRSGHNVVLVDLGPYDVEKM